MIYVLFLFVSASQALHLKKSLGDIYLSQNEVHELALSDFFVGNNLTYQILSTNSEKDEIYLENKMNLELLSFSPYPPQRNQNLTTSPSQKSYTVLTYFSHQILCDFYENNIYLYNFSECSNDFSLIWYGEIKTEYKFSQIKSVLGICQSFKTKYLLLIQLQQQEIIDGNSVWRNDFYIMDLTDILKISEPLLINLSDLTYANNIIMTAPENRQIVSIYAEFPDNKNAILFYNFTNPYNPICIQNITQYFTTPKEIQTLSVKSILASQIHFFVLDSNIGLIIYSCRSRSQCIEKSFIDLRSAGDIKSMWYLCGPSKSNEAINIMTNKGNILIALIGDIKHWVPAYKNNGFVYSPTFAQYVDNFYFIQYGISDKSIFNIYKNSNFENALYQVDIGKMIGKYYNQNGSWMVTQRPISKLIAYFRSDFDGIRVFELKISPYSLKVKGNSNFKAEIIAYENNNGSLNSVSSIINVISIPENANEIYLLNDYRPATISPINVLVDRHKSEIFLYPVNYFSGPNLNFKVTTPDSKFFTFEASQIEKLKYIDNQTLPKDIEKVEISNDLVYFFKDHIDVRSLIINVTNPIKVFEDGSGAIIYWKTEEFTPMITYYSYSQFIIIQTWEPAAECKIFKKKKMVNQLICSDGEIIDIYYENQELWERRILLSGNDFEGNFTWNLSDIEMCSFAPNEQINNYLYLADKDKGLLVIDLWGLSSLPFPYFISDISLTGILKMFSTLEDIIFIRENYSINIFAGPLSYKRKIQIENSGTFTRAEIYRNIILLQLDETLFAINIDAPVQNALYFEKKIKPQSYILLNSNWRPEKTLDKQFLHLFYLNSTEKYYETYLMHCPGEAQDLLNTKLSNEISIQVKNPQTLVKQIYSAEITLAADNSFKHSSINLPLNLIVNGAFAWFEPHNWNIKRTVNYDDHYEIDLNNAFFGQNLDFSLNINGQYINNSQSSTFPATITQKIEMIDFYSSQTTLFHQALIPNTSIRIFTSAEGFIILNSLGFQRSLNFSNYSFNNLKCSLIDVLNFTKNNTALLATSCTSQTNDFSNTEDSPSKINLLVLWEFDYISSSMNIFTFLQISYNPWYLKIIPLNKTDFEIMTVQKYSYYQITQMLHFRGKWTADRIDIKQIGSIDAISLNLPSFTSIFFDGFSENSENTVWFILDNSYGIRILKASSKGLEIIDGISHDQTGNYFSIGLCGDYLYALKLSNTLQKILIKDLTNLKIIETFYYDNKYLPQHTRISCSEDGKYISSIHNLDGSTQILRIYDTSAKSSSFILADIKICNCRQSLYVPEYIFLNSNSISIIECAPGRNVATFKINPSVLKIPKLNSSEYETIIDEWGTNSFDIFITAKNDNNEVNSSTVRIERGIAEKYKESQNKEMWLIWLIVATAVTLTGAMSFIFMKNLILKTKHKTLENQALVLMTIKENQV
ncbi:unnamed protein product [Blepharisma stoltei]|uniref:Transmembrane protein n=1 Tax=Blepharisma stoltei TaxID=1481888 RepID=A0AAU9JRT2_9CILI|nr:unnamed protein product [Blepharisma stoltei]